MNAVPVQFNMLRHKMSKFKPIQIIAIFISVAFLFSFVKIYNSTSVGPLLTEDKSLENKLSNDANLASNIPASNAPGLNTPADSFPDLANAQSYAKENATILTLCRNEDLADILKSVRRLEDRFNHKFHYDWVFLNNEEFSVDFMQAVSNLVSGDAKFGLIKSEHWSYPDYIDQELAKEEREKMTQKGVIYADSESYRHMCRFNSGFFYHHPLLQEYKYYWRVEPGVDFYCDVVEDPFKFLRENNKVYGFTISIHEFVVTIESMWGHIKEFLKSNPSYVHQNNLMDFISEDNGETYNLCHFWSNFEIADMDFWRSNVYEEFFQHLDKTGGFFYERWGDAPIHSIAVALFLDKSKIHYFDNIGYNHGVYSMCPIDRAVYKKNKCLCDKDQDFTFRDYACGKQYYKAMGLDRPQGWERYADNSST